MPGPEEEEISRAAATYLVGEMPVSRCHRPGADLIDSERMKEIAELGWLGLSLPESLGGVGLSAVDDVMLFREAGRYLAPLTLLTTGLAARVAAEAQHSVAAALLSGQRQAALAINDPQTEPRLRLFDWKGATLVLLIEREGASLFELDSEQITPVDCLDKTVSMGLVDPDRLSLILSSNGPATKLRGSLNAAAMLVGMAEAELDMIVDYARIRETFGRPIGAYQAVRHPCADMAVRCEAARSQLYAAAVSVRDGHADAGAQVGAAKLLANAAAVRNADSNIQLHGGIAVTMEHDAHLYMKRANLLARLFGSDRELLERLLDAKLAA